MRCNSSGIVSQPQRYMIFSQQFAEASLYGFDIFLLILYHQQNSLTQLWFLPQ